MRIVCRSRSSVGLEIVAPRRRRALAGLVLVLVFVAMSPMPVAFAQNLLGLAEGAPAREEPPRSIPATRLTNEDKLLAKRLGEIYSQVDGLGDIVIQVESGVVVLSGEAFSGAAHQKALRIANQLQGVIEVQDEIAESRDLQRRLRPVLSELRERFIGFLMGIPLMIVSLIAFLIFFFAGRIVSRWESLYRRLSRNPFARDLLRQAIRIGFVLLGAVIALEILDATAVVAAVAGVAGLAGLAVSFAFRDLAENYIASVLLSLRQPFQADEHVVIEGHEGHIVRLTSRATILINLDGNHVRIPNATVFKGTILNYSRNPHRRFVFDVGVASGEDLTNALNVGIGALDAMPDVVSEPAASGWVSGLGDWSVLLRFSGWIDQRVTHWFKARGEGIRSVKEAFDAAGIVMPEPLMSLHPADEGAASSGETASRQAKGSKGAHDPRMIDTSPDSEIQSASEQDRAEADSDLLDSSRPRE